MYGVFLNPSSASAEQAGVILVFGLAAFGLLLIMVMGMCMERM